jgi:hypothetical protein
MTNCNSTKTIYVWRGAVVAVVTYFKALLQYKLPRSEKQHNNAAGIIGHSRNSNQTNEK